VHVRQKNVSEQRQIPLAPSEFHPLANVDEIFSNVGSGLGLETYRNLSNRNVVPAIRPTSYQLGINVSMVKRAFEGVLKAIFA
jgi:hypothetical protein